MDERTQDRLSMIQRCAAVIGIAGAALCAVGYWWSPARFFEAYLFALLVVSGIGLGCLAVLMLHHLVGGWWGLATRRILEAACWPLVVAPILAAPLALGIETLYPWADPAVVEGDELLQYKAPYLNVVFFQQRAVGYLLVWAGLALLLSWWSRAADRSPDQAASRLRRLRKLSAAGLVIYVLTMTFASIDWMMSLEPHWFSAIYGVIIVAGQGAAAYAVAIITLYWLREDGELSDLARPAVFQDLGNLLLAAVTFWIYVTFSQFLIIWSGNLPEEVPWYLVRSQGGWQWVAVVLVLLHFVVPFFALLSRERKRVPRYVAAVAILVAIMHVVDVFWLLMPALRERLSVHWLDLAALATLGAWWKSISLWRLRGAALVPAESYETGIQHGHTGTIQQPG